MNTTLDWTPEQAVKTDACAFCHKVLPLRHEPFCDKLTCRECWEQICYGEED